jgi:hypothetical protein
LVKAAATHKRVLQMGNQRRSWPNVSAAIAELHAVLLAALILQKHGIPITAPLLALEKKRLFPNG